MKGRWISLGVTVMALSGGVMLAQESEAVTLPIPEVFRKASTGGNPTGALGTPVRSILHRLGRSWVAGSNLVVQIETPDGKPWKPQYETTEIEVMGRVKDLSISNRLITVMCDANDIAYRKGK
jgi:hypothetical protein